ncbi:MAG: SPOR domain-containing protein, partial [Alphaproteobacteria bacterium]
ESTVKSGDKTVLSDPGAITATGTVNHISPGTQVRPSQDDLSLNRKASDSGTPQPSTEAPVATQDHLAAPPAGGQLATDITLQPQSKPPVPEKFRAGSGKPGYRVQIFALTSDAAVRKAWPRLQKAHPDLLGGLNLKVVRTTRGPRKGIVYRMQVGTLSSAAAALKLCDRLRQRNLDCILVRS